MTAYLNSAITDDWAAMDGGKSSPATTDALNALYAAALAYRSSDSHGEAVMAEILRQLNTITEARRARLVKASGIVPGVIHSRPARGQRIPLADEPLVVGRHLRIDFVRPPPLIKAPSNG